MVHSQQQCQLQHMIKARLTLIARGLQHHKAQAYRYAACWIGLPLSEQVCVGIQVTMLAYWPSFNQMKLQDNGRLRSRFASWLKTLCKPRMPWLQQALALCYLPC